MAKSEQFLIPEGYERHHRQKGTRRKDERPVNVLVVGTAAIYTLSDRYITRYLDNDGRDWT